MSEVDNEIGDFEIMKKGEFVQDKYGNLLEKVEKGEYPPCLWKK